LKAAPFSTQEGNISFVRENLTVAEVNIEASALILVFLPLTAGTLVEETEFMQF
jgi:hypothetical protein